MQEKLYPLLFRPIYKEKIWGGRTLKALFGRALPPGKIGESWDVAAHPNGMSVVQAGPLAGRSLGELFETCPDELVGHKRPDPQDRFPLLLKLIDARDLLSVQVHPHDSHLQGQSGEVFGKTELWYVVDCEPGAWIIWGLRSGVTKEDLERALREGGEAILECLNRILVRPGELYPISSGLVHALGAGVVVAEIQQNSDTTYRLYDWERLDEKGRARQLHQEEALEVIDFSPSVLERCYQFSRCEEHFKLEVLERPSLSVRAGGGACRIFTALGGPAQILWEGGRTVLPPGRSCLLPACLKSFELSSSDVVLQSSLPESFGGSENNYFSKVKY